ncbi:Phosphoribosyl-AMP cyclohydrolase [Pseudoalteromonas luteoviolacea B = ATCC 29581]|nr:Phosphoribosyl-AMP cyclohydrolase [Pseudoalteromonas luteoviolacea B = ATCC 29581]
MQITPENIHAVDFDKSDLLPAIIQDPLTGVVLMQGYMNQAALSTTFEKGLVTFYSRSKARLWTKGESSENYLQLHSVFTDCDKDALLVFATPKGPTCHLGTQSCFPEAQPELAFVGQLQRIIDERRNASPETSYTASLFAKDLSRSCQKVGEEGVEVALAAMKHDKEELLNESADLLYHLSVLLKRSNCSLSEVANVLATRHK